MIASVKSWFKEDFKSSALAEEEVARSSNSRKESHVSPNTSRNCYISEIWKVKFIPFSAAVETCWYRESMEAIFSVVFANEAGSN